MNKKILWGGVGIIIIIVIGVFVLQEPSGIDENPPAKEGGVEIVFRYGVGAKNELNTIQGTFTRDMVIDPSVTIPFELSEDIKDSIYQKAMDLNIFTVSTDPLEENIQVIPCSSYYVQITTASGEKETSWDTCRGEVDESLRTFSDYLIQTIMDEEEYQTLPTPNGGYM